MDINGYLVLEIQRNVHNAQAESGTMPKSRVTVKKQYIITVDAFPAKHKMIYELLKRFLMIEKMVGEIEVKTI